MKEGGARRKSDGPPQELDRPGKIIVTGIPKDDVYSEADLEKEFSRFGRITEAYIVRDRRDKKGSNRSRGFAFITFENPKDANDAMTAMEGKDLGGERKIHCEQAVVAPRKSDDYNEDGPRGRGSERGRGREGRGRGMERGWRGGDRGGRGGGGRGMEWGEYRGDPRGGRGFRGGMMRGRGEGMGMRGRGRGDYFEPEMHGDDFYDHGPQGPPDMPRGRPGRRTLLPNPNFRGGRGQGPPPGPPRGRGGPPMMRGGEDYYEEGPDGYYDHGEGRGAYTEGYDEGYQEDEYYDHPPYPDRMPQRGGPGGGRGARPFRGRGMPPHEGMGMSREEVEYSHRGEEYPARRGMGGGDYGGRGSGPMRRGGPGPGPAPSGRARESNPPEEYLPPKRQMVDDYGYPAEEGADMRRKEAARRAPPGQYPEDDYDYDSYPRRSDYYEGAPRGRGASGGRGGRAPPPSARGASGQRRAPLLGHDPYEGEDSGPDYYQAPPAQSQAPERYEDDEYSHPRGVGQTPARRRPLAGDDSYGYDAVPAKTSQLLDDGYSQKRSASGPGMYDQAYQEESLDTARRRDDYDNLRQSGIRRSEMDYPSPADDYSHRGSDMYASYAPRSRGTMESRDVESDPYSRKRLLDYGEDVRMSEMSEVRRDYQDFHDRSAGMQPGPSSSKRDRFDGFYQSRQEEVYREL